MFANRQQLISSIWQLYLLKSQRSKTCTQKLRWIRETQKSEKAIEQHIEEKVFSSWSMKFAPFNNIEWGNKELDAGIYSKTSVLQLP